MKLITRNKETIYLINLPPCVQTNNQSVLSVNSLGIFVGVWGESMILEYTFVTLNEDIVSFK